MNYLLKLFIKYYLLKINVWSIRKLRIKILESQILANL